MKNLSKRGEATLQKVLIVGAGRGGMTILKFLRETALFQIAAIVDIHENAPGMKLARKMGIRTESDWKPLLTDEIGMAVEVTGDKKVFQEMKEVCGKQTVLIPGNIAHMMARLLQEKESLILQLKNEQNKHNVIFDSTDEGMVGIDLREKIILYNKSAERIIGIKKEQAIGTPVRQIIPTSRLPRILRTKKAEVNQEQVLANGLKIITTRIPMMDENQNIMGAFAVFRDITEVLNLAEEITNLKEVQTMLEAIIHSSDDAISVVDEKGRGILINPAYTRITGLTEEQVIGKPANADISEGESVHMEVLEKRKPVRGVKMKVGPKRKEVVVNVAPIIVNGTLKGSVGVIHDVSEIQALTQELNRARQIIRTLEAKYTFEDIVGESEEIKFAIEQAKLGANTPATVLLRGESGTGKELFAHAIHNASDRRYNKFVRVNCAAISETLLESELFGYEEGAFSGAKRGGKIGLFEEANNGSIFLDEVGELSPNTQAKLLRVLQEQEIVRVGGTKPIPINVRVIAATNVSLEKGIAEGTFREDLYYRLNRMPIQIPPLRQRKTDIPLLCRYLLAKINQDYGRNVERISSEAMKKLMDYDWPGNVRELENVLGRAVIFMNYHETMMDVDHLFFLQSQPKEYPLESPIHGLKEGTTLSSLMDEYEKNIIQETLMQTGGNKTEAAKRLGISIRNLYYKIAKYKLQ
ncbi:sigma 54-interacting transcriptional regulator [Bacillus smithii]|uniref:sigma-54 interaction domain-containing protein n=1 Tax=Bacillus smithii TaxID=1479 RepID=UPI003D230DA4